MCGRYTSTSPPPILAEQFVVDEVKLDDDLEPRWNVAPTLPVLVVAESRSSGKRRLGTMRWGLVPSWAKDIAVGNRMINARAETVSSKPAYKRALSRRRCIIPADAFYEWKVVGETTTKTGRKKQLKQPYAIARADGQPLAFAGLWEVWHDPENPDGDPLRSCVIITTEANEALSSIHDRMPVVLGPEDWDRWLDPDVEDPEKVTGLLVPAPSGDFVTWPVRPLVNSPGNEGEELIEPADDVLDDAPSPAPGGGPDPA
jgi:putative SOS response-associated peptidase YedK